MRKAQTNYQNYQDPNYVNQQQTDYSFENTQGNDINYYTYPQQNIPYNVPTNNYPTVAPAMFQPTDYPQSMYQQPDYQQSVYQPQMFHPQQPQQPQESQQNFNFNFPVPNDFVADTALKYGSSVMEQGNEFLQRNIEKYVPTSTMKYYFAVDNMYVAKKLLLLIFPFAQKNWAMQFNHDKQPVPPRCDLNAPDLYIPMMALLTFVLNCGFFFGLANKFSPDQLGAMASTSLAYLLVEILLLMLTLHLTSAKTSLRYMDMVAFSGYKFVGMNFILLMSLLFETNGYIGSLIYFSLALDYFLLRTLKLQVLPNDDSSVTEGNKRRVYLLLTTAVVQPLVMWLLTRSVVL